MSECAIPLDVTDMDQIPPPDLKGRTLRTSAKKLLVDECHRKDSCYQSVVEKYNVKHNTLRKYYKRVSRGIPTYESGGRPTKLDDESVNFIINFLAECEGGEMFVHDLIRKEFHNTMRRRYPAGLPADIKPSISKTSVRRWAATLISRQNYMNNELSTYV